MLSEEYEYPNLFVREKEDEYTNKMDKRFGFRTDRVTRPLILAELQRIFKENINLIKDILILKEGIVFIKNEKGRAEAQEGCHDDLIMGTAIAYYICGQQTTTVEIDQIKKEQMQFCFKSQKPISEDYGEEIEIV